MALDEILTALKARAFDKGQAKVAEEIGVSDDTLRRILSDTPPAWLKTMRRMEEIVRPAAP